MSWSLEKLKQIPELRDVASDQQVGGLRATVPKLMWDDAILKVSPSLAAVSTLMLIFVSVMILAAEWLRRRSARG